MLARQRIYCRMAQIRLVAEADAPANVQPIYEEIKKALGIPVVPGLFKVMANDPEYLEATWRQFKSVMRPGELSRREKELVALAVSATNSCTYCIRAHTAALKGLGLTDRGILELMAVVGLFNNFNKLLDGLLVEPDIGV